MYLVHLSDVNIFVLILINGTH